MAPKRNTTARGYGFAHQQTRKQWEPIVATGTVPCARCHKLIKPGQPWHLDHTDDRTSYLGPSHKQCNIGAPGKYTERRPQEQHPGLR